MSQSTAIIDIENLSFTYPKTAAPVLVIPKWKVRHGDRVFINGESGSGKSTLLKLLSGLEVGEGSLKVDGVEIGKLSARARDRFRAQKTGIVFQQFNLIPYLSALENVLLAASLAGQLNSSTKQRASELLAAVSLGDDTRGKVVRLLSVGQQQRVAIARALINSPKLLLFDEPTSSLDSKNGQLFIDMLFDVLQSYPATLIFVSHDHRHAGRFDEEITIEKFLPSYLGAGE